MCLYANDVKQGRCCNPNNNDCYNMAQDQTVSLTYCATKDNIQNEFMRNFVCPARTNECPNHDQATIDIKISGTEYYREYIWWHQVPVENDNYHCKYVIRADKSLWEGKDDYNKGYIFV